MRVAHLLRKYNPAEWGGTETAVKQLLDGLRVQEVENVVYCPRLTSPVIHDPLSESASRISRFHAFVPVWGISEQQKRQLISVGGNLMSFDLLTSLMREPRLSIIHAHTGNRLGGIALTVARAKKIPLVATIHGGVLDLPDSAKEFLRKPLEGGFEWGKLFGAVFRSRHVLRDSAAILTCNKREAALLQQKFPNKRVIVQSHGVTASFYEKDRRVDACRAFPQIIGRQLLLSVGRIDPVKNQQWLVEQLGPTFNKFPDSILVLAGSCTDPSYGDSLKALICQKGLEHRVVLTGGLPPGDPRLIGLLQQAKVLLLPSLAETFGLVLLEAWAAGCPVISSMTSGAKDLVRPGENGWLFDLEKPADMHAAIEAVLINEAIAKAYGAAGRELVKRKFDTIVLAGQVKKLYEELIEEKK